jgi:hypothetical protein
MRVENNPITYQYSLSEIKRKIVVLKRAAHNSHTAPEDLARAAIELFSNSQ